jgi:alpha-amylase
MVSNDSDDKSLCLKLLLATYFVWDAPAVNRTETNGGQKLAIVELFGWPYTAIESECVFLGKAGYGGVRIWPPSGRLFDTVGSPVLTENL